jgi:LmbE family N-acetylglucosaminyl deacetylase
MRLERLGRLEQLCLERHLRAKRTSHITGAVEHADSAPTVVLSPHLDDAVLSTWSVVGGAGGVDIVNVFAGVPDDGPPPRWDRLAGATSRRAHMEARLDEDRAALALAGRSAVYLPFLDRHYRTAAPEPDQVADAIGAAVGAASLVYAPAGIGGHEDHVLVRDVALEIGRRAGLPVRLYAELPYAIRFGWPSWVTGDAHEADRAADVDWEMHLSSMPVPRAALSERVFTLDHAQMEAKLAAMKRYRTQFRLLNQRPFGVLEHPLVLPWEVAWTVPRGRPG